MNTLTLIAITYIVITFNVAVGQAIEDSIGPQSHQPVRHHIVKRKGGKGGGGRSRGNSGSSKKTSPSKNTNSHPYPKQPPYNPNYNPNTGHQTGYGQQHGQQHGQHNPSYPSYNTGQQYGHGQQMGYPGQTGHKNSKHKSNTGLLGGSGAGLGHKSKGLGAGLLGGAAVGGLAGTALGAYGGYKLGRMVGSLGRHGYYGYFVEGRYYRCDPPPRIEFDPEKNTSYIPLDDNYDSRCLYYDDDPIRFSTNYFNSRHGVNAQNKCIFSAFTLIIAFILSHVITRVTTFRSFFQLT